MVICSNTLRNRFGFLTATGNLSTGMQLRAALVLLVVLGWTASLAVTASAVRAGRELG
jgi:hypothetical protein